MIDRVQVDPDGIVHVADYKTTKNKKYLKDDWFQLLTYAYVMLKEDPSIKKIRASYILLRHDFDFITTEFYADDIIKIHDQYVDYAKKIIDEKEFKPNPTNLCSFCDFVDICDSAKRSDWDTSNFSKTGFGEVSW
jgi:CRISPR/Cas system-associated exonuclease Cas4 (RecB family)